MEVKPQRALILIRDGGKRRFFCVAEDVLTDAFDDVLPGAVRQQHDALGHFLDLLALAHRQGRQYRLHDGALVLFALLFVQFRHGQTEFPHHEFTEDCRRQVAEQLGQIFSIVHRHSPFARF